MATPFIQTVTGTGQVTNDFSLQFAADKYDCTLTSGGGEVNLTVPGGSGIGVSMSDTNRYVALIKIEPATTVWVALNATATATAGAAFAATNSELIKSGDGRYVKAGDVLHFITNDATADVGVTFYATK